MIFSIVTLFPEVIESFLKHSIIGKAQKKHKVIFKFYNPRDQTEDKHRTVDDRPFGGGSGMLLKIAPIVETIEKAESESGKAHKIYLTPHGSIWTQQLAKTTISLSVKNNNKHMLLLCGHYEGIDWRIDDFIDEKISIGKYILSSGESAAIVFIDSLIRLIPGVLSKKEATEIESFMDIDKEELYKITGDKKVLKLLQKKIKLFEYPQYTRPESYRGKNIPKILLTGNHEEIKKWRLKQSWQLSKRLADTEF
jgi:tRNA (guanine37-N1)-methyltransferase